MIVPYSSAMWITRHTVPLPVGYYENEEYPYTEFLPMLDCR